MSSVRHTSDNLTPIINSCTSYAQVLLKLGLKQSGGNHSHIRKVVNKLQLSTSHFLGQASNLGKPSPTKRTYNEILVKGLPGDNRVHAHILRRALKESGRPYECAGCGNPGTWLGASMTLQVHHKDGKCYNNSAGNIDFICPNCHSMTSNFGFTGSKSTTPKSKRFCVECGVPLGRKSKTGKCQKCNLDHIRTLVVKKTKITWPSVAEMTALVGSTPVSTIARDLGVSDVAVAKFCKKHGIPRKTRGDWNRKSPQQ